MFQIGDGTHGLVCAEHIRGAAVAVSAGQIDARTGWNVHPVLVTHEDLYSAAGRRRRSEGVQTLDQTGLMRTLEMDPRPLLLACALVLGAAFRPPEVNGVSQCKVKW